MMSLPSEPQGRNGTPTPSVLITGELNSGERTVKESTILHHVKKL